MSSAHCGEAHALDSEFQNLFSFFELDSLSLLGTRYPILWVTPGGSLFLIVSPFFLHFYYTPSQVFLHATAVTFL